MDLIGLLSIFCRPKKEGKSRKKTCIEYIQEDLHSKEEELEHWTPHYIKSGTQLSSVGINSYHFWAKL